MIYDFFALSGQFLIKNEEKIPKFDQKLAKKAYKSKNRKFVRLRFRNYLFTSSVEDALTS